MGCFGYICKECGTAIRGDVHNGGENCVLIHVRHGKEIGRVEGHYDEYGRVVEQEGMDEELRFRGDGDNNPNSHSEIISSEMQQKDSYVKLLQFRVFDGDWIDFRGFCKKRCAEELVKADYDMYTFAYEEMVLAKAVVDEKFSKKLNEYNAVRKKYVYVDKTEEEKQETIRYLNCMSDSMFNDLVWDFYEYDNEFMKAEWNELPKVEMDAYSGIVAYHARCHRRAIRRKTFNLIPSEFDPSQSWGKIRKRFK